MYFTLSIKPPLHPTFKYLVHFQFPLWSISTDNLNTMQDSERHLRIKNNYQIKSGKSAVGRCIKPTYFSNVINCLNPTGATRSILKLGNYDVHSSLRTAILICIFKKYARFSNLCPYTKICNQKAM